MFYTVQPRYNEQRFNEVIIWVNKDIGNDFNINTNAKNWRFDKIKLSFSQVPAKREAKYKQCGKGGSQITNHGLILYNEPQYSENHQIFGPTVKPYPVITNNSNTKYKTLYHSGHTKGFYLLFVGILTLYSQINAIDRIIITLQV